MGCYCYIYLHSSEEILILPITILLGKKIVQSFNHWPEGSGGAREERGVIALFTYIALKRSLYCLSPYCWVRK